MRDIYVEAGYSRWLHNPRLEFMLYDGSTLYLEDTIRLYQGAYVTLYVCTVPYDDSESESQGSTACPDDSWPDVTDETDTASLLQFLDGPLGHNDGKYGWFGGFPCPCDRWCSSQNNHAVAHSKDEGPIHDMQHRKWKWIQECRSEAELA